MKVIINIKKKHLMILILVLILFSISFVIAGLNEWTNAGKPQSHTTLWTQEIKAKDTAEINVRDSLILNIGKGISLNGAFKSAWPEGCFIFSPNGNVPSGYTSRQGRISSFYSAAGSCGTCTKSSQERCSSYSVGQWVTGLSSSSDTYKRCEKSCYASETCTSGQSWREYQDIKLDQVLYCM